MLREAIERERAVGGLETVGNLADSPGFQRRLARRVASWRLAERGPDAEPPVGGPVEREEWKVYSRYLELLEELGRADERRLLVDPPGLAGWASRRLRDLWPSELAGAERLVVIDPPALPAVRRALRAMLRLDCPVLVALAGESGADRLGVFAESEALGRQLLDRGFRLESVGDPDSVDPARPAGLAGVARDLFRENDAPLEKLADATGIELVGEPQGAGVARAVAATVRDRLASGTPAEEILILVRSWDDQAQQILETLEDWGWPTASEQGQPMRLDPTLRTLLIAIRLPSNDWDTEPLARLLRNGLVRLKVESEVEAHPLAAAAAVRDARVFRGLQPLREALARKLSDPEEPSEEGRSAFGSRRKQRDRERARHALPILDRLHEIIGRRAIDGTWSEQTSSLAAIARDLGLTDSPTAGLDALLDALDEVGEVLAGLGHRGRTQSWETFVSAVERVIREQSVPATSAPPGALLLATVDEARGRVARHVVLANLAEKTFPAAEATRPDRVESASLEDAAAGLGESDEQAEPDSLGPRLPLNFDLVMTPTRSDPLGREMLRFLRVVGSAGERLTLIYPTADSKGTKLLPAGFLEDLKDLFDPEAVRSITRHREQLDPSMLEVKDGSPAERRISAVARAIQGDSGLLNQLAKDLDQAPFLSRIRETIRVARHRARGQSRFSRYEGILRDPLAIQRVASFFGPHYPFSASQLETVVSCPYKFFLEYVTKLEPVEERDELDEDLSDRGLFLHGVLERLHKVEGDDPLVGTDMLQWASGRMAEVIEEELSKRKKPLTDVEAGILRIEKHRVDRTIRKYMSQLEKYVEKVGVDAACVATEYTFGGEDSEGSILRIGEGDWAVRLQGKIDRIDVIDKGDVKFFRVIDYKSGSVPDKKKVERGQALQHAIYAMAVERYPTLVPDAVPLDCGYWGLRDTGYKASHEVKDLQRWAEYRESLCAYVIRVVDRLRRGEFPVHPIEVGCQKSCDYRSVCRIHQIRPARKRWEDDPRKNPPK